MSTEPRSMTAAELLDTVEVERLALRPGDILVFKSPTLLSEEEFETIRERLKAELPDTKVLFVEGGADLAVLRTEP